MMFSRPRTNCSLRFLNMNMLINDNAPEIKNIPKEINCSCAKTGSPAAFSQTGKTKMSTALTTKAISR